jgi:predicted transcriptional regulator YdeE/predicted enzyme related to lactoylglutathione lyase
MNESSHYQIRFEMKPAFTIVGELRKTSLQDNFINGTVPKLMNEFFAARVNEVRHRINAPEFYGILDFSEEGPNSGRFSWIAGVEVSTLDDIPQGMMSKNYPTLLYAIITHRGTSDLSKVFDYMYQTWLPQSEYESAGPFSFQFHGQHYRGPFDPESEVDVCFPVRPITSGIAGAGKSDENGFRFGAVFVPVSDMPRAVKWYSQVLGIPIKPGFDLDRNENTIYDFQIGGVDLLLDNIGAVPVENPNVLFYIKIPEIQLTLSALKQQGVDIVSIEDSTHSKSIIVRDPDGNKITFLEERINAKPSSIV